MTFLALAYLSSNVIAEALYVPQLVRVVRNPEAVDGLSPTTWFGWTFTSLISLGYAWFDVHDWPFALATAVNLVFLILTSVCIVIRKCKS